MPPSTRKPRAKKAAPPRKKIALIGYTSSLYDAPWGDPDWDIWPVNNLHAVIPDELWPQATAWFNLHRWDEIEGDEQHVEWLEAGHMPVYLFERTIAKALKAGHSFPTGIVFPADDIREASEPLAGADYFTNSISWMIAFAHLTLTERCTVDGEADYEGAEIGLWGIDMAQGSEYSSQRPSCEYWLGLANGAGIKVTIAEKADLLKAHALYGLEDGNAFATKMRARTAELTGRLDEANGRVGQLLSELEQTRYVQHQLTGALESQRYIEGVWLQPVGTRKGGADPYSTSSTASSSTS